MMDPNANLQEQETLLTALNAGAEQAGDSARLRDLRSALVGWLRSGGFAPDWVRCPLASAYFRLIRLVRADANAQHIAEVSAETAYGRTVGYPFSLKVF